ncbi:ATP-binding protein [Actinotalea sp. M2MS4P-6]|uniref:sacsin N-terminal ATP-binding-like domain-containing protein n=1 Tax=Actinotalea sp. M2MS4P-6 TaxID=2983762 RepID=UPI0021E48C40|nr:ATP-binding protein [Actinotalea sp. M2MS4P-6]MCV2395087.1 ATP-binding protein [Actinotalea sp. M2MS4P-6]
MTSTSLPSVAARLRAATLAAWADHPGRFREDANAEEDHAAGWYRDRVVVELAQNAADAAQAAGRPGRLLLRLSADGRTLVAANTGAPLDGAGLTSLASLRASAKRGVASVGRFGVGFAAVRSVADEVAVVSTTGAVHFSAVRTAIELAALPALVEEVDARAGALPVLRLPFDGAGPAAEGVLDGGWDTAVVLHLRDDSAVAEVRSQLMGLDDALLLALPGLASVEIEVDGTSRTLAEVAARWVTVTATGRLDPGLLAERPVEERERTDWRVTWAVPTSGAGVRRVVHAPTPTDDPCGVPALLIGTFPLDPGRRRVAPGPIADLLVAEAGRLWPDLLVACRRAAEQGDPAPDPLDLLPSGFPAGALDAALRTAVVDATRDAPVLPTASAWVTPREAAALAAPWDGGDAAGLLGGWFDTLVQVGPGRRDELRVLEVATVGLGELVEQLPVTDPAALREVYGLLASSPSGDLDELGAAPVPLVDGRVVRGARGTVVVEGVGADVLAPLVTWGLRVVHPEAAHPVLERLGAVRAGAGELACHPVLRDHVLDGDPDAADVLLGLVEAAPATEDPGWWSHVLLEVGGGDADGEIAPARELVLPGSPAAGWFDPEVLPPVGAAVVARWGEVLERVGVRGGLVVERVDDLVADALDGWEDYLDTTGAVDDGELLVVADLDAVRDWPGVLVALADHPELIAPVRAADGALVPSYVAWRLRDEPGLGTGRPFALPGADRSAGVLAHLDPTPAVLAGLGPHAEPLLRALGGVGGADGLATEDWALLLDDLVEGDAVPLDLAVDVWRALAAHVDDLGELAEVPTLPGWDGSGARAYPADELVVADPQWRRHPAAWPVLPAPAGLAEAVADALGLDLAADRAPGEVASGGTRRPVSQAVVGLVPGLPGSVIHHETLEVDGHRLAWWLADDLHVTDDGLADGLAAVAGWHLRHVLARVLAAGPDPSQAAAARTEALLDSLD